MPPLRLEGNSQLSGLLESTRAVSFASAGYRRSAFVKMSEHINGAGPDGYHATHTIGWAINPATGNAVPNQRVRVGHPAGPARVDMEIMAGRAFGDR